LLFAVASSRGMRSHPHAGTTRFLLGRAGAHAVEELSTVELIAGGASVLTVGRSGEALGSLARLTVWGKALDDVALDGIFALEREAHGCPAPPPAMGRVVVRGRALDSSEGVPLHDAALSWPGGEQPLCSTGEDGFFEFELGEELAATERQLLLACSKPGYAPAVVAIALPSEGAAMATVATVTVALLRAESGMVSSQAGGTVTHSSGASVTLSADSVVCADGSAYDGGKVAVHMSVIDAQDDASLACMPGDFSAVDRAGHHVQLESYGAMWVGLAGEEGEELALRAESSMRLTLRSTVPINSDKLGVLPSLWQFDEANGKWIGDEDGLKLA